MAKSTLTRAAQGAAAGSVAGPAGMAFGAVYGIDNADEIDEKGWAGTLHDDVFGESPKFEAPEYEKGNPFENTYGPTELKAGEAYTGKYDGVGGANQLMATEAALDIEAFDKDTYTEALEGGLRANVRESTKQRVGQVGDAAAGRNLGRSGGARALTNQAHLAGARDLALGLADIEQDAVGKKLQEDARRTNTATDISGRVLQNEQFEATYGEGQRQFDNKFNQAENQFEATYGLDVFRANEDQRLADADNIYGMSLDEFQQNVAGPQARRDSNFAGVMGAAGSVASAAIPAAATLLCRAAEATFGLDHPKTNRARYAVNVEWPAWAQDLYRRNMHQLAAVIRKNRLARWVAAAFFDAVGRGKPEMLPDGRVR